MKFFSFWRSLASFRVRIALNLKKLPAEVVFVDLDANAHRADEYRRINPQMALPSLALDDGTVLFQSLAILEYLEETHPQPPLLPAAPAARATVRAMALSIACDIHPLGNLRVLQYLRAEFGQGDEAIARWNREWMSRGFTALETWIARHSADGRHCFGSAVTLADVCLLPQVFNSRRVQLDLAPWPRLADVARHLERLPAFAAARPEAQPDAE